VEVHVPSWVSPASFVLGQTLQWEGRGWIPLTQPVINLAATPYGVVGNDVADDTAALVAALAAAAADPDGGAVIVPPGLKLKVTSPIDVPNNVSVIGYGAKLRNACPGTTDRLLRVVGKTNVTIAGLEINGDKASFAPATEQRHNIFITNSSRVTLRDVYSHDAKGDGIYVGDGTDGLSTDVTLFGGQFSANHRNGGSLSRCRRFKAIGTRFNSTSGTAPQTGFDIEPNADTDEIEDIEFIGCTFDGNVGDGLGVLLRTSPSVNQQGISAIGCSYKSNSGHGLKLQNARDFATLGGQALENALNGVKIQGTTGRNIRLSTPCTRNGQCGIAHDTGTMEDLLIDANCWDNGTSVTNTYDGVLLAATTTRVRVIGATLGGPSGTNQQRYGLRAGASATQLTVLGCTYPNNVTAEKLITTTSYLELAGNKSTGWGAPTGTATKTTFDTASVTLPQLAERMKALLDYLTTRGDIGA